MCEQYIYTGDTAIGALTVMFQKNDISKLLVVCDTCCRELYMTKKIAGLPIDLIWFHEFQPNPTYESVVAGVELFHKEQCESILAIGGGSAMDVAKCIKLFSSMDRSTNYLNQPPEENHVLLIAIPTTAGTGSEATRFAVIYHKGEKQSISHPSMIPKYVIMEPEVLKTLPDYQKKATMMDAFCHAVESYWSVNSTHSSKDFSKLALILLLSNMNGYLENTEEGNKNMLLAANMAGKAINITQTTAGHAMCYKLSSLYGISHGHAAVLCLPKLWAYMKVHIDQCIDPRGREYLEQTFIELANIIGCNTVEEAVKKIESIVRKLQLNTPKLHGREELDILKTSVNPTRLKNHPIGLTEKNLKLIYCDIFNV